MCALVWREVKPLLSTTHICCTNSADSDFHPGYRQRNLKLGLREVMAKLLLAKAPCSLQHKQLSCPKAAQTCSTTDIPGHGLAGTRHQVPAVKSFAATGLLGQLVSWLELCKKATCFFHSTARVLSQVWKGICLKWLLNSAYNKHDWNTSQRKIPHSLTNSCLLTAAASKLNSAQRPRGSVLVCHKWKMLPIKCP